MIPWLLGLALAATPSLGPRVRSPVPALQGSPTTLRQSPASWTLDVRSKAHSIGDRVDFGSVSAAAGHPAVGERVATEEGVFLVIEVAVTAERTERTIASGSVVGTRRIRAPTTPLAPKVGGRRRGPRRAGALRSTVHATPQLEVTAPAGVGGSRVFVSLDGDFSRGHAIELGNAPTVLDVPLESGRAVVHHLGLWIPDNVVGEQLHDVQYTLKFP